jgi:hypothetical protein
LTGDPPIKLALTVALLAAAFAAPAAAATAPQVSIASIDQLAQPLPVPYNVDAIGAAQVAAARKRAKVGHKLLLIGLGGNWCTDCRVLAGIFEVPEIKAFIDSHYEVVTVDIGRRDKNLDGLRRRYQGRASGADRRSEDRQAAQPRPLCRAVRRLPHDPAGARRLAGAMGGVRV